MEIIEAIRTRRSIRKYKDSEVPKKVLEQVIDAARWAGSPQNTQPLEIAIVGGNVIKDLKAHLLEKTQTNAPEQKQFPSLDLPEPYSSRAAEYRNTADAFQFPPGTKDLDEKRRLYGLTGVQFRSAPNAIIIHAEKAIALHPYVCIAAGIFAQNICLAAMAYGLGTCILGTRYSTMMAELLAIPQSKIVLCCVGIGYPDMEARINNFPRSRIPIQSWVTYHGF